MPKTLSLVGHRLRRRSRQIGFVLSGFQEDPRWFRQNDWKIDIDWLFVKSGFTSYPIFDDSECNSPKVTNAERIKIILMIFFFFKSLRWTICLLFISDVSPWNYYLGNISHSLGVPKAILSLPMLVAGYTTFIFQITFELSRKDRSWLVPYQSLSLNSNHHPILSGTNERKFRHQSLALLWFTSSLYHIVPLFSLGSGSIALAICWPPEYLWPWAPLAVIESAPYFYVGYNTYLEVTALFIIPLTQMC